MRIAPRVTTALALGVLPLALLGTFAKTLKARLAPAAQMEFVEAPSVWVPFRAKVTIDLPNASKVLGRFYRDSNGSERMETGPALDDVRVIFIKNLQKRSAYSFTPEGWRREPLSPIGGDLPMKWRKDLPGWSLHPFRLAIRLGDSGSTEASTGFLAYHVVTANGTTALKVPELNLFDVDLRRPDGWHQSFTEIELVDSDASLFQPPTDAVLD